MQSVGGQVTYLKVQQIGQEGLEAIFRGITIGRYGHQFILTGVRGNRLYTDESGQAFSVPIQEGEEIILNSSGALNYKLARVRDNTKVIITYLGKKVQTKGNFAGSEYHDCDVKAEAEGIIHVPRDFKLEAMQKQAQQLHMQGGMMPQQPVATAGYIATPTPIAQPVPQPMAQPAPQPIAQPAPQPIAQPAPQPVAQQVPQQAPQQVNLSPEHKNAMEQMISAIQGV